MSSFKFKTMRRDGSAEGVLRKDHADSGISQAKRTIVGRVDVAEKYIDVNLMNLFQSFLLKSISCCLTIPVVDDVVVDDGC